jgi:hypothetical protein
LHDIGLWSLDAFFDTPHQQGNRDGLHRYAVYYNYDFGPNHTRFIGPFEHRLWHRRTPRQRHPASGTGHIGFVETGYLLPKALLGPKLRVQPYASHCSPGTKGSVPAAATSRT